MAETQKHPAQSPKIDRRTTGQAIAKFGYDIALNLPLLGLSITYSGLENLPKRGQSGIVAAGPHQTYFDAHQLTYSVLDKLGRPVTFIAGRDMFDKKRHRFVGRVLRPLGAIPINRYGIPSPDEVREVDSKLNEGRLLGIFPQGETSHDGQLGDFSSGVGYFALRHVANLKPVPDETKSGINIYPVGIAAERWRPFGYQIPRTGWVPPLMHFHFGAPYWVPREIQTEEETNTGKKKTRIRTRPEMRAERHNIADTMRGLVEEAVQKANEEYETIHRHAPKPLPKRKKPAKK